MVSKTIQFNSFQYFLIQWGFYWSIIGTLISIVSAYESKPKLDEIDTWSNFAKSMDKNDLYLVCKHFGEALSKSNLLKEYTSPLSDNFWNFYSRDIVSQELLLSSFLTSYPFLSDAGKDTLKTVTDSIIAQTFNLYSIDHVAMHFLDCTFKFGYIPNLKHLKNIAIVHTLIVFNSANQSSISDSKLPQTLDITPFDILKWEPVLVKWTILAKFVKDPITVNALYSSTGTKPVNFDQVNKLFNSLFN
jgi:hypothetical protein